MQLAEYKNFFHYLWPKNRNKVLKGLVTRYEDLKSDDKLRTNMNNLYNSFCLSRASMVAWDLPKSGIYDKGIGYWGRLED